MSKKQYWKRNYTDICEICKTIIFNKQKGAKYCRDCAEIKASEDRKKSVLEYKKRNGLM